MRFILPFVILFSFAGAQAEVLSLNYFAADAANSKAIQKTVEDVRNNSLTVPRYLILITVRAGETRCQTLQCSDRHKDAHQPI